MTTTAERLPALAIAGSLQIYPATGAQLSIAELLRTPLAAICLGDGVRELVHWRHQFSIVSRFATGVMAAVMPWRHIGFGSLDPLITMREVRAAAVLLTVGVQTLFASFFSASSVLNTRSRRARPT